MKNLVLLAIALASTPLYAASHREVVAAVLIKEAGGEGEVGLRAVACVIQNRGLTPYQVVTKRYQFSCYNYVTEGSQTQTSFVNIAKNHARWAYALELADQIGTLRDITGGARYFDTNDSTAYWAKIFTPTVTIGHHTFYVDPNAN